MSGYVCKTCGASGCKLWRAYQSFHIELACARCALAQQKENGPIDRAGVRRGEFSRTDQIGWMVPAIPVDGEPDSYWGYTSVPEAPAAWWEQLPTYSARVRIRWCQPGRKRRRKNRQQARALDARRRMGAQ